MTRAGRGSHDEGMLVDHFPLLGLRLRTPRLELRLPSPEDLATLAEVAADGIHGADVMPFLVPWTDQRPAEVARSVIQYHWLKLGSWSPRAWSLNLTVFRGDDASGSRPSARATWPSSAKWIPAPGWDSAIKGRGSAPRCGPPCCT
jgi:hypothetical protein